MYSAADLIAALRRRERRSLRLGADSLATTAGWSAWFEQSPAGDGGLRAGDRVAPLMAVLLTRAPPARAAAPPMSTPAAAFRSLWRQRWDPPVRDERPARALSAGASGLLHVLFAIVLLWLLATGFMAAEPEPEQSRIGETVTQVEFIGVGTPEQAPTPPPIPATETRSQPEAAAPVAAAAPPPPPQASVEPTAARPVPAPAPAPASQPLQVTEVARPDIAFVLPPTRAVALGMPSRPAPEVPLRERSITVVDAPPVLRAPPEVVPVVRPPSIDATAPELVVRDIPSPVPVLRTPSSRPSPSGLSEPRDMVPVARAIPMPASPPSPAAATADVSTAAPGTATAAAAAAATATSPTAQAPAPASDSTPAPAPASAVAGSANATASPPGAQAPSLRRGDDWGLGTRDRAGGTAGTPGLYNPDGSPRLAGGARVGGGLPPGTITEDYEKIDRMGTWLKRPPVGYQPTAFDRFWVPHETLLQEWVRRSIKEVLIPIPGTSKRIKCSVALLALGGACGFSDANMQDVEAGARPPPDVPFRPDLQEDQDSLRKPG